MNNIDTAVDRLVSMAFTSVFLDDVSEDEAALQLIALFENNKDKFSPDEQIVMKQITVEAVKIVTGKL